jgi:penicillin-binding protein 1A
MCPLRPRRNTGAPRTPRRRRIRKLRLLGLLTALLLLGTVAFGFGLVRAISEEIPELDPARVQQTERNGVIYARDGRTVLSILRGSESRTIVDSDHIAPLMKQAIVAIEDRRFWEHRGIDIRGVARALWADIRQQAVVEGGSTITQQFVKNTLIRDERSIGRKVREAALAWQLEDKWSGPRGKDRILTAYLNTIYFGNGAYGVQQAALTYFGHGARALTLPEAALLAGIPADPTLYDPVQNPRQARERRAVVLRAMLDQDDISQADFAEANAAPLPKPDDVRLPGTQRNEGQYFVNYVKEQLIERYGAATVFGGGLRVTTTIDLGLQRMAREAIDDVLKDPNGPSAALVAIDPRSGEVLAMVGGENYRESQFNLAAQAKRQPGSAFKPFVLAAALRQGISPQTRFDSKPLDVPLGDKVWSVSNYEDSYLGNADLETATVTSDNSVYAQLTLLVGANRVARMARDLGLSSPLTPYYAIGLGVEEVNPLEMARAYATFANGGRRVDGSIFGNRPRVVRELVNGSGKRVQNGQEFKRVLPPAQNAILTSILEDVVHSGTGRRAAVAGQSVAGKTGTTENYGDAWFVGYTPQLAVAVWVGYPTTLRPMLTEFDGDAVAGGTFPAEIFKSFAERALRLPRFERGQQAFPAAPYLAASSRSVVRRGGQLAADNGICRNTRQVVYFAGWGPKTLADCKVNEVAVPVVVGRPLAAARERLAAQPLTSQVVAVPSKPGQRPGLVVSQEPKKGFLSSYDRVVLFVTKARDGVVPDVVGVPVDQAQERLKQLKLQPSISWGDGPPGTVMAQQPKPGVAAAPGLTVQLVVARG